MNVTTGSGEVRLEFFSRADSAAPERRQLIRDWLDRLGAAGTVGRIVHHQWPPTVHMASTEPVVSWFETFAEWADRAGASVEPPFRVNRRQSAFTGTDRDVLVTPELCLAAYVDDVIVAVRPCKRDGAIETIEGFLSALEADGTGPPLLADSPQ